MSDVVIGAVCPRCRKNHKAAYLEPVICCGVVFWSMAPDEDRVRISVSSSLRRVQLEGRACEYTSCDSQVVNYFYPEWESAIISRFAIERDAPGLGKHLEFGWNNRFDLARGGVDATSYEIWDMRAGLVPWRIFSSWTSPQYPREITWQILTTYRGGELKVEIKDPGDRNWFDVRRRPPFDPEMFEDFVRRFPMPKRVDVNRYLDGILDKAPITPRRRMDDSSND